MQAVIEELRASIREARAAAQRDHPGSSGLYYWTGFADGLELTIGALETGHLQPPLPLR